MILSANMISFLTAQYGNETANSVFYASLQSWAEMRGLDGTAAFLEKQSKGERDHADMILSYIHDRNEQLKSVDMSILPAVPVDFPSLFAMVQGREQATSEQIYAIKAQAEAEGDAMTCAWIMQPGGLILEQCEEERLIQTIIDRITIRGTDAATAHDIDVWISGLK
jgi:ferritin